MQALEAEASLLGALLLEPEQLLKVGRLAADDFVAAQHNAVFVAVSELFSSGAPVDLITVNARLAGKSEAVGGLSFLSSLINGVLTATNAGHYAGLVMDASRSRKFQLAASSSVARVSGGSDWRKELTDLRSYLEDLEVEAVGKPLTLGQVARAELASINAGECSQTGLPSGLGIERVSPDGIPCDKVTTIFGLSGNFKTTLTSNLAWNIAAAGYPVLFISLEDSARLEAQRLIARQTGIGYGKLAARQTDGTVSVSKDALATADRIIIADPGECTMNEVIRLAQYYKRTNGIKVVFLDYLQMLEGPRSQKDTLEDAMKRAMRMAVRDTVGFVMVSQLVKTAAPERNREFGTNKLPEDMRPNIEDCFGSSAMRMCTKLGLGVFRPWKHVPVPHVTGALGAYAKIAKVWPTGAADFLENVYPRILEIGLSKNIIGEAPAVVHCLVELATGKLEPLDLSAYAGLK